MARYYKINEEKIINTVNIIPEDMLEKKGLLKVEIIEEKIPEGQTPIKDTGIYFEAGKCIDHRVIYYHIDTLEEAKEKKLIGLANYMKPKFPAIYKQCNAALGIYDDLKSKDIKDLIIAERDYHNLHEEAILALETIEEVELYDFMKEEDKVDI